MSQLNNDDKSSTKSMQSSFPPTREHGRRRVVIVDSFGMATDAVLDRRFFVEQYGVPFRQLRVLENSKVHQTSAQIFVNRKAHVVNLEFIKLIIAVDKCYLFQVASPRLEGQGEGGKSQGVGGWQYQVEDSRPKIDHPFVEQLCNYVADPDSSTLPELRHNLDLDLPFELRVLEFALSESIQIFEMKADRLQYEAKQALSYLVQKVSNKALELVRDANQELVVLSGKLDRLNKELMELLDDDQDMLDLYLNEEVQPARVISPAVSRLTSRLSSLKEDQQQICKDINANKAKSLPHSHHFKIRTQDMQDTPFQKLEERAGSDSVMDMGINQLSENQSDIEENIPLILESLKHLHDQQHSQVHPHQVKDVEALLDTYYMHTDFLMNRLKNLDDLFDDTKDIVNIDLDNRRNELVSLDLILTAITGSFSFIAMIAGIFGMNLENGHESSYSSFLIVCIVSALFAIVLLLAILIYSKWKGLMFIPQNPALLAK